MHTGHGIEPTVLIKVVLLILLNLPYQTSIHKTIETHDMLAHHIMTCTYAVHDDHSNFDCKFVTVTLAINFYFFVRVIQCNLGYNSLNHDIQW